MKRIKRFASLVLALVMVFAMSVTAFASSLPGDENSGDTGAGTGTTETTITHEYEIYQIFTGDYDVTTKRLSNIRWGKNGTGTVGDRVDEDTLKALDAIANEEENSDTEQLAVIRSFAKLPPAEDAAAPVATGSGTEYTGLAQGYYLVMDKIGSLDQYESDAVYTLYVVQVVDGTLEFAPKADVPHGDKQTYVVKPDGSFEAADGNYGTIGSHVSYVITSEVPDHTNFDYYYFIMNDTLDKGLVFDGAQTVKITIGGKDVLNTDEKTNYHVYVGDDAKVGTTQYSFRLAFDNIKDYNVGDEIVVTYSATVTSDVEKIGVEGNANTWQLQYSNNPNEEYDGTRNNDKPGLPLEENTPSFGKTPEEKTLTFLTQLDITKYADSVAEGNKLRDAVFTLSGTSNQVVLTNVEYYREATEAEKANKEIEKYWKLLALSDDQKEQYTTEAPTGTEYVKIGVGTKDTKSGYVREGENNFVVPTDGKYEGKDVYKLVKGTATNYADVNVTYVKDTKTETSVVPVEVSIEMKTGEDGKISFAGIGAGTYTLTETVTPAGYNTLDPITITVEWKFDPNKVADGTEKCEWKMTANEESGLKIAQGTTNGANNGIFAADVINKSGSLLPSTGGIGTTIFYVIGGILVLGAGVLLIVRKRMNKLQ